MIDKDGSTYRVASPMVIANARALLEAGRGLLGAEPGKDVVVDLASTNGTRVNGARISEHPLRDRDEVVFGNTVVHFEAS